jgi:hypothetical protein
MLDRKMKEIERFERLWKLFVNKNEVILESKAVAEWFKNQLQEIGIEATVTKQNFHFYKVK